MYCLNGTVGEVWKLCDGKSDPKEIAKILSRKFSDNFTEDLVFLSLDELFKENLSSEDFSKDGLFTGASRREVIKRIGLSKMIALPFIAAVTMPTSANAQPGCPAPGGGNPIPNVCHCDCGDGGCESGFCSAGVCSPPGVCVTAATCGATLACPVGFDCCNPADVTNTSTFTPTGCLC